MCELTESVSTHYPQVDIRVFPVINRFFGERITVVGLLTAQDMMEQIPEAKDYDALLLADSVFRAEDDVTLDDVTLEALIDYYGIPVYRVKVNARDLLNHILYGGKNE
jgi:NifB/MoaA-like Fe-S oxidoreductase